MVTAKNIIDFLDVGEFKLELVNIPFITQNQLYQVEWTTKTLHLELKEGSDFIKIYFYIEDPDDRAKRFVELFLNHYSSHMLGDSFPLVQLGVDLSVGACLCISDFDTPNRLTRHLKAFTNLIYLVLHRLKPYDPLQEPTDLHGYM